MKIVIAPDSFKGSLSACEAADNIRVGIARVYRDAELVCVPMADGGEGTVQAMVDATTGRIVKLQVMDPLQKYIEAFYGILGDGKTAIIEMAAASGLPLVPENKRNPMLTTSYGTGELIKHALDMGCREIIIGIGGSATNDGGFGMAKALGFQFLDSGGRDIGHGGGALGRLQRIDSSKADSRLKQCTITVACDVQNPLCGPMGATYVFGPQKGASSEMLEMLDKNLEHYAAVVKSATQIDIKDCPGAGAAGGMGGGLMALLDARLKKGIDIVMDKVNLEQHLQGTDLVITGEGRMDSQTQYGKTPFGVMQAAKKYQVPVIGIAGQLGEGIEELYDLGFDSVFSIVDGPLSLQEALADAPKLLQHTAERVMRLYKAAKA